MERTFKATSVKRISITNTKMVGLREFSWQFNVFIALKPEL